MVLPITVISAYQYVSINISHPLFFTAKRNRERRSEDLRDLIVAANVTRPFVFLGDELGSLHARFYAQVA